MSLPTTRLCLPYAQLRSFCQNTRFRNPELAANVIERILELSRGDDRSCIAGGKESLARRPEPGSGRSDEKDLLAIWQSIEPFMHPFGRVAIQNLIKICKLIVDALNL